MLTTDSSVSVPSLASNQESLASEAHRQERLLQSMKAQYRSEHQVEFLHLQAEAESLLQKLHAIKRQREEVVEQRELVEAGR